LQLTSTKDIENKQTLLHYLVDTIERKFPDCLSFFEELAHVDRASRVSLENIQRTLRQMDANIRNLEQDLTNAKIPQNDKDLFAKVMTVQYIIIFICSIIVMLKRRISLNHNHNLRILFTAICEES
jgi:hypothetical protein